MTTLRRAAAFCLLIYASVLVAAPAPARGDFMFGSTPNPPQSPTGYAESNETFTWFWEWNGEEPPFGEVFFADLFPPGRSQYDEPGALWRVQITAIRQPPNSFFRFQIRAQHASQADSIDILLSPGQAEYHVTFAPGLTNLENPGPRILDSKAITHPTILGDTPHTDVYSLVFRSRDPTTGKVTFQLTGVHFGGVVVPEPSSLALALAGGLTLAVAGRLGRSPS